MSYTEIPLDGSSNFEELPLNDEDQVQINARQVEDLLRSRGQHDANDDLSAGRAWAEGKIDKDRGRYTEILPEGFNAPGEKQFGQAIKDGIESGGVRGVKALIGIAKMESEIGGGFRDWFWNTGVGKTLGGKPEFIAQFEEGLKEWTDSMEEGLAVYGRENQDVAMQMDADAGFWETTFDILKSPEKVLQGIVEAIPLLLQAGAGTIIAGPVGAIAAMSQPIAGETYMDARAEGTSPMKALIQAELTGLGEAAIENWTFSKKIGLAKGFRKIISKGGKEILWEGAKLYGRGMVEEGSQAFNENVWNWLFTDRSQDLTEGVLQSAAVGGPLELVMGGGFAAAGGVYSKLVGKDEQLDIVRKLQQGVNENPTMAQEFKDELNEEFEKVIYDIAENKFVEAPVEEEGNFVFDENGEFIGERDPQLALTEEEAADRLIEGEEADTIIEDIGEVQTEPERAVAKLKQLISTVLISQIRQTTQIERDQEVGTRIHKGEQARKKALKQGHSIQDAQRIAKSVMRGELAKANFPAFTNEQFTPSEWELVRQAVLDKGEKFYAQEHAFEAVNKLQDGIVPPPFELDALGEVIGKEAVNTIADNAKGIISMLQGIVKELINLPVTLLASSEVSMIGRQGVTALTRWPIKWTKALVHSYKAYFNDDWARMKQNELLTRELNNQAMGHGVEMTDMDASQDRRHERFQSTWAKKIPYVGVLVRASERAAVVGMNSLRAQIYDQYAEDWGDSQPSSEYIKLAEIANAATGRGNVTNKKIKAILPWLNAAFFSPRYVWSRFELVVMGAQGVWDVITPGKARATSKIQAQMLVSFVSSGMAAMTMAAILGADIEKDWRSSDFGKIKLGRTRYDVWGGFQQIARTVAQMSYGQGKSTSGEKEIYTKNRLETFGRFLQSKLSPVSSLGVEMLTGKDFLGEPLPEFKNTNEFWEYAIYKKLTPLIIQDTIDAIKHSESKPGLAFAFPAAFHGVGVQTYDRKAIDDLTEMQDFYAKQVFHKPWKDMGPDAQEALTEYRPQIAKQAAIAKYERRNATFDLQKQREAGVEIEKALPDGILDELKTYQVTVGGLSRTLTRNWRLNKTLYKQYKDDVSRLLNAVLPKVINSNVYGQQSPANKQLILNEIIKDTKSAIRKSIVQKANFKDLEDIRKGVEQDG